MYGFEDCVICDKSFDAKCNARAHKKMHTDSVNVELERIPHLMLDWEGFHTLQMMDWEGFYTL